MATNCSHSKTGEVLRGILEVSEITGKLLMSNIA